MPGPGRRRRGRPAGADLVLRVVVALGLGVDAYVHFHLAPGYQLAAPGGIGEGTLFRIEAAVAVVLALAVLVAGGRVVGALAFLVAAAGLVAVLVYRYVDVPAFGPFPSMYEPVWFGEKTVSAVAEAVAALGALLLLLRSGRRPRAGAPGTAAAPEPVQGARSAHRRRGVGS